MLTSRISGCKCSANHENKQIYLNNSQMPTALKATKQTKTKQKTVKMLCSSDNNWQSSPAGTHCTRTIEGDTKETRGNTFAATDNHIIEPNRAKHTLFIGI